MHNAHSFHLSIRYKIRPGQILGNYSIPLHTLEVYLGPHPSGPTFGALTFCMSGPHSSGPTNPWGPHPWGGGPPGLHFFWVWALTFLIFIMLLIGFFFVHLNCFYFLSFFDFCEIFTVFVFVGFCLKIFFYIFHFSSWGGGRRQTQTPN